QVAAEGVPALGFRLARLGPPAPEADAGECAEQHRCVRDRAAAERDEDDVAPARRDRAPAVDADPEQDDTGDHERAERRTEHGRPGIEVPALLAERGADTLLERREALRVLRPAGLDSRAKLAQPL